MYCTSRDILCTVYILYILYHSTQPAESTQGWTARIAFDVALDVARHRHGPCVPLTAMSPLSHPLRQQHAAAIPAPWPSRHVERADVSWAADCRLILLGTSAIRRCLPAWTRRHAHSTPARPFPFHTAFNLTGTLPVYYKYVGAVSASAPVKYCGSDDESTSCPS